MKKEELTVAGGQYSAKSEIRNQKSEIGSVNEEGSLKNEENEVSNDTSHSSHLTPNCSKAADFSLLTPNCSEAADTSLKTTDTSEAEIKHITEYSSYLDIMKNAAMRAPRDYEHPDQIAYSFTTEEMIQLARDEEFAEVFPDMAAEIRAEVVKMYGSG